MRVQVCRHAAPEAQSAGPVYRGDQFGGRPQYPGHPEHERQHRDPRAGVRIDPGPVSQGFISNVEGVLDRIEQVVKGAFNWGNEVEQENAAKLLADIVRVKAGTYPITLILEDPSGNSGIESERTVKEAYTPEE